MKDNLVSVTLNWATLQWIKITLNSANMKFRKLMYLPLFLETDVSSTFSEIDVSSTFLKLIYLPLFWALSECIHWFQLTDGMSCFFFLAGDAGSLPGWCVPRPVPIYCWEPLCDFGSWAVLHSSCSCRLYQCGLLSREDSSGSRNVSRNNYRITQMTTRT